MRSSKLRNSSAHANTITELKSKSAETSSSASGPAESNNNRIGKKDVLTPETESDLVKLKSKQSKEVNSDKNKEVSQNSQKYLN